MSASTAFFDGTARAGVNVHQFYSLDLKGTPAAALADVYAFEGARGTKVKTQFEMDGWLLPQPPYLRQASLRIHLRATSMPKTQRSAWIKHALPP